MSLLFRRATACGAALSSVVLAASPAFAHHMMDGEMPATFTQGLLSGLGHPIIGPDHLAFILAAGLAVAVARLPLMLPVLFVALSCLGVGVHVAGMNLPAAEIVVGLSVLVAGGAIASGRALPVAAWAVLFAIAGLFHGYAYGESIFGAETTPIVVYLLGLAVIQSVIALGAALLLRHRAWIAGKLPRLLGGAVALVGLAALAGQV
ncbi:HupE/UreJ family protein [Niveispirillum sp. KHB5.9]|uniref:HupE/UreJ family protein n=1 Tax=Niveispirillum sp. KHB5.9 TaxID=3400269 RepID=UPI003A890041